MNPRAISPVVGVALFLVITVALVAIAGVWFVGFQDEVGATPRASVDVTYEPGFSLHTHSVRFAVEAVENTDELVVRSPASNACSGEKRLGAAGSGVEFTLCSPGDRFTVVAETDSTTTLIKEYTIPTRA